MGDISEDWEVVEEEEDSLCTEERKSNAMWILDKGLNIGKKIVITGVVISSAPFILPPLVVVSALGFAFSVPSWILLSTYACTEKLMSKLLPIGDEYWEEGFESEDRDLEEEKGDASYIVYGYEEPLTKSAKVEQPLDDHVSVTEEDVQMENNSLGAGEKFPTLEKAIEKDIQEAEKEDKVTADTTETAQEEKEADTRGAVAGKGDEKDVGVTVGAEKTVINGNEPNKKTAKKKKGTKKQDPGVRQKEILKKNEDEKDFPDKTSQDTVELRSSAEVSEPKQVAAISTGKEVKLGEEKIWETIDALRAIVGYKASPHITYIEELRALYMFTGVEPPVSLKDSSDLVEVNDKLGFLMSVFGVK